MAAKENEEQSECPLVGKEDFIGVGAVSCHWTESDALWYPLETCRAQPASERLPRREWGDSSTREPKLGLAGSPLWLMRRLRAEQVREGGQGRSRVALQRGLGVCRGEACQSWRAEPGGVASGAPPGACQLPPAPRRPRGDEWARRGRPAAGLSL